jgi:hypothetical protein
MPSLPFENEHLVVHAVTGDNIIAVVRKPTRVELAELDRVWGAATRALAAVERDVSCLLVDVSAAVGRNDEAFEQAFAPFRQRLCADWLEVALVVSSLPGKLQVQRYAREDGARVTAFDNHETALTALRRTLASRK